MDQVPIQAFNESYVSKPLLFDTVNTKFKTPSKTSRACDI